MKSRTVGEVGECGAELAASLAGVEWNTSSSMLNRGLVLVATVLLLLLLLLFSCSGQSVLMGLFPFVLKIETGRGQKKREARMKSIEQPAEFEQLWEDDQRKCQLTN